MRILGCVHTESEIASEANEAMCMVDTRSAILARLLFRYMFASLCNSFFDILLVCIGTMVFLSLLLVL